LLSLDGVARFLATSRRTVERLRAAGKFPRPDLHLNRMPRWQRQTILNWIERGGK
jgi:predicted DNA-binding transcriptional regulator AlpA